MTEPLVAFLKARLDEDEAAARRVDTSWRQDGETGVILASDGRNAEECAAAYWTGIAEHIVRHDPRRVLADIAAKRLLIKEYEGEAWVSKQQGHKSGWTEGGLSARRTLLEAFAKVYDDHPDHQDKWTDTESPWAD